MRETSLRSQIYKIQNIKIKIVERLVQIIILGLQYSG